MAWDSIVGQQRVKGLLAATLRQNRLAHAYLFSGPEGVGKDAVAIELAKVLNCEHGTVESCESCPSCAKFASLQHPNLHLIFALPVGKGEVSGDSPTGKLSGEDLALLREQIVLKAKNLYHNIVLPKASTIKVNSIRGIRSSSALTAYGSGKKVFIIMDAEQLNDEASNALLKTFEEPHENTLLILTTAHPDVLLPTIVSRCQQIRFDYLHDVEIQQALQRRESLDAEKAALFARIANGSYSRALELMSSTLLEQRKASVEYLRSALRRSRVELFQTIDQIVTGLERAEIEEFLNILQSWLRDAAAMQEGSDKIINVDDIESLKKFVAHYSEIDYVSLFRVIGRSISLLNKNVYIPLILINLAVDLRKSILRSSPEQKVSSA